MPNENVILTTQNAQCRASLALIQSACKLQRIYRRFYKIFRNQTENFLRNLIALFFVLWKHIAGGFHRETM